MYNLDQIEAWFIKFLFSWISVSESKVNVHCYSYFI